MPRGDLTKERKNQLKLVRNLVFICLFIILIPIVTCMGVCGKAAVNVANEDAKAQRELNEAQHAKDWDPPTPHKAKPKAKKRRKRNRKGQQ